MLGISQITTDKLMAFAIHAIGRCVELDEHEQDPDGRGGYFLYHLKLYEHDDGTWEPASNLWRTW